MQKYKIGCLPVLDGEKLVGLITDSDFVNVAINHYFGGVELPSRQRPTSHRVNL